MSKVSENEEVVLPHHKQQDLCTTRLPYRQGRKLTAVKVYTINDESNHLLIFGVPSLKLRLEAKSLFLKFGKLILFNISTLHPAEPFTETYHAAYERIQSARVAKKMLDTTNFYGGSLHVCYAPELETVDETKQKLFQRQRDVLNRLRNLQRDHDVAKEQSLLKSKGDESSRNKNNDINLKKYDFIQRKLNMGEVNTISIGKQVRDVVLKKRKTELSKVIVKKFKPNSDVDGHCSKETKIENDRIFDNNGKDVGGSTEIEAIDCTSVEKETITNINEILNYNKFGNEIVRKIPKKPVNRIKFNIKNVTKNKL